MTYASTSQWEWRTFGGAFHELDGLLPAVAETAHDTFVVMREAATILRIRNDVAELRTLAAIQRPLELWLTTCTLPFPLCQREVRELLRGFGVSPPELFLPQYTAITFLTDVASCVDGFTVVGAVTNFKQASVDGCHVERASLLLAGEVFQTIAIASADPAAALHLVNRLHLSRWPNVNLPSFLKHSVTAAAALELTASARDAAR